MKFLLFTIVVNILISCAVLSPLNDVFKIPKFDPSYFISKENDNAEIPQSKLSNKPTYKHNEIPKSQMQTQLQMKQQMQMPQQTQIQLPMLNNQPQQPTSAPSQQNPQKIDGIKLKSMEDLPVFLEKSNYTEKQGLCIISKFLNANDVILKKDGAVFDQSGFDGLIEVEPIAAPNTVEWSTQRARSASRIWVNSYK